MDNILNNINMSDNVHISLIFDDEHSENLSISKSDNIDKICDDLVEKYQIDPMVKVALANKIKNHVLAMKNTQETLTWKVKEIVKRLYDEELKIKRKKEKEKTALRKKEKEEEKKIYTFSPKISVNSDEDVLSWKNIHQRTKSRSSQENLLIKKIIKYAEEVEECKQYKSSKSKKSKMKEKIGDKNVIIKSSLKFIDRDLKEETQNDFFIPNINFRSSIVNNDLNLHLTKDSIIRTGLTFNSSKFVPLRDSYAEIYKNQMNYQVSINNSSMTGLSLQVPKSNLKGKAMQINYSRNKSDDNLFEIKESEGLDTLDIITCPSQMEKEEKDFEAFSKGLSEREQNVLRNSLRFTFKSAMNTIKPSKQKEKEDNELKKQKCEKRLKEIEENLPKSFKVMVNNEKIGKRKKEKVEEKILKEYYPFKPTINKKTEKIMNTKFKGREKNCFNRLFSPQLGQRNKKNSSEFVNTFSSSEKI